MSFGLPAALLFALPLGLWWWRTRPASRWARGLRAAVLAAVVLAVAQPRLERGAGGSDLVVVVDRSRSMPERADDTASELLGYLDRERRPGDRLGVVTFGAGARVELPLSAAARFAGFTRPVEPDGSDLGAALDAAADLIPPDRAGRVFLLSDGKANGPDPRDAARRLAARGVAVDYRALAREDSALDLAVGGLALPSRVAAREPFQFGASVRASQAVTGRVTLRRNGVPLVDGPYDFQAGDNALTFRDLVEAAGLVAYELRVTAPNDGVPENDVGRGVLRVEGAPRVLLISGEGKPDAVSQTLAAAGLQLEHRAPFPVTLGALDGVAAVVLEDVPASRLSEAGLRVLAQYVEVGGGGLVMTGGRHSFGEGGYRKSAVEEVLPVSLEVREEQRRAAIALSILMDCSCSMGVQVPDGRTKMQLAGEGAVAALELLNEKDEASVTVIDTESHVLFPMSPVSEGLPLEKVAGAFSGGGGIYIGVALRDGRNQILKAKEATRHVVLFADAADSEVPDDYRRSLADLRAHNVTVSVIGMGTAHDSDAHLLEEVASLGGGRIYFADDPTALPRVFSEETIAIARSAFVEDPTRLAWGADLPQLGRPVAGEPPSLGGYNLTYLKPQASLALRAQDDNQAPVLAFWPRGAGKAVAFAAEADGAYTGGLRNWPGYSSLLERMVRWAMPAGPTGVPDQVARVSRRGTDVHVTLDFDRAAPPPENATLVMLPGEAQAAPVELPLRWEEEDRLGAHFTLPGTGTWFPVLRAGARVVRAPPVTLPYSPEFEPSSAREGRELLAALAAMTGGVERHSVAGLFQQGAQSRAAIPLAAWLVAFALVAALAEVWVRRFLSAPRQSRAVPVARPRPAAAVPSTPGAPAPSAPALSPRQRSALEIAADRARERLKR